MSSFGYKDPEFPTGLNEAENNLYKKFSVFAVMSETELGPVFSSKKEAEAYLDKEDKDNEEETTWRKLRQSEGYPDIWEIKVGDTNFMIDR